MPYTRPKGRKNKDLINKKGFEYNKELDVYVWPIGCILNLSTINKDGYKEYKSNKKDCENCPMREKCTKSKNHQKVITRHIWQNKKDEVNEERFTRLRGLEKNSNQVLLIFTCYNLKKMGLWKWKTRKKALKNAHYLSIIRKLLKIFQKKVVYFFKYTTLSLNYFAFKFCCVVI